MKKNNPSKHPAIFSKTLGFAIPLILATAAGVFFASRHSSLSEDAAVHETVARLQALESSDITATENALRELTASTETSLLTADEIRTNILNGELLGDIEIRQAFKGTVILGDSITESIWEYGYLDTDVVISQRGMSVAAADDLISTAINMNPSVVFMSFGTNDLETFLDDAEGFVTGYRQQVQKIQSALPDVPIFINLILPITDEAINNTPALQYYPAYNEELLNMCEDMGLTPIDNSFIVENNTGLYEPDGQHVIAEYYPKWLTNMAEMAGLA